MKPEQWQPGWRQHVRQVDRRLPPGVWQDCKPPEASCRERKLLIHRSYWSRWKSTVPATVEAAAWFKGRRQWSPAYQRVWVIDGKIRVNSCNGITEVVPHGWIDAALALCIIFEPCLEELCQRLQKAHGNGKFLPLCKLGVSLCICNALCNSAHVGKCPSRRFRSHCLLFLRNPPRIPCLIVPIFCLRLNC